MLLRKLLNLIKQAVVTWTDDTMAYPRGQAAYNGKTSSYMRLSPYGLCSNPPEGSWVALFSLQGQESVKFGIADDMINRMKNLSPGEAALYNTQTQSYALLKADGNIEVAANGDIEASATGDITAEAGGSIEATAASSATITAPAIALNGNVSIAGTLTQTGGGAASFSGDMTIATGLSVDGLNYGTHKHDGIEPGAGVSGGPV